MYQKYVKLRDERKLTDYQVSIGAKVTKSTFSDWKAGRSEPGLQKIAAIAKYFGVPIEYFVTSKKE